MAAQTTEAMDVDSDVPDIPNPSAPCATTLDTLFYNTVSPRWSLDSPTRPQCRKRRSFPPEPARPTDDLALSSSPPSSPTQRKVENPILTGGSSAKEESKKMPTLRPFSALIPPKGFSSNESYSDESSFDGSDMSSPAQAYAKRQQVKTIRRCDGSDDLKPMTAIPIRDMQESPSNKFMTGCLPGFGDNEAHGKILPCHSSRVTEDGLMRINCKTVNYILVESHSTNHVSSPLSLAGRPARWSICFSDFRVPRNRLSV
jgi:M-phase inducer tyrosine phosphatase